MRRGRHAVGRPGRAGSCSAVALFVAGFGAVFVALGACSAGLGGLLVEHQDPITRVLGVVVIVLGLGFLGADPRAADVKCASTCAARGALGRAAARRDVRARLDAVHRPDAGRGATLSPRRGPRRRGARCSPSRTASGSGLPFLVAASRRARRRRLGALRQHRLRSAVRRRDARAVGLALVTGLWADLVAWLQGLSAAPVRAGDLSVHRARGPLRRLQEPTEAPARRAGHATLGLVGWLRWAWRQLTSMRTALLLLLLLARRGGAGTAVAAARRQDPARSPATSPTTPRRPVARPARRSSTCTPRVWFSAIYLLLFVSLVGCILPRTKVHLAGVRGRPPRAPRRFARFPAQAPARRRATPAEVAAGRRAVLRGGWRWLPFVPTYRVDTRDEGDGTLGVRGARLPARDRQPRLPPRPRRAAHLRGHRPGAALPRAGDRRAGPRFANAQVDYDTFERAPRSPRRAWCRSRCASTSSSPASTRTRSSPATSPRTSP